MARTMSDSQMRYREEQQRKRLNREQEMKKLMEHVYGADKGQGGRCMMRGMGQIPLVRP
jgi:hypothetical protein